MKNLFVILILVIVLGSAVAYLIKQRKKGVTCIGCPDGGCKSCKGCHHQ